MPFSLKNLTRTKKPSVPYSKLAESILKIDYDLSLVFIGDTRSRLLNNSYRKKNKVANVLSFPLSETEGEIALNLSAAKREAPDYKMNYTQFVRYLFIHGCLHLKGLKHGRTMDRLERKFLL
jgi:probable rRNA maturation factor